MGTIRHIDLRINYKSTYAKDFNPESHVVSELYWSFLRSYIIPSATQQITIVLSDNRSNSLSSQGAVKGFKDAYLHFDFKKYFSLDKYDRKKMQLEAVHEGMMEIAEKENWTTDSLMEAYNNCLKSNLEYQFNKGKPKFSRNRKYKIGLWCDWDMDFIEVYWILYDKNNDERQRGLLTKRLSYEGNFVYFLKWKWLDNSRILFEDTYKYGKNEKWVIIPNTD